jgi:hypothetical protein
LLGVVAVLAVRKAVVDSVAAVMRVSMDQQVL